MRSQWAKWFAWYPVRLINGQLVWLKTVYYQKEWMFDDETGLYMVHQYGTLFDVMKNSK